MTTQKYEGRSAAEAAINACDELNVSRSALRYEVVSETGEGLDKVVEISVDIDASAAADADRPASPPRQREDEGESSAGNERGGRDRGERSSRGRSSGGRGGRGGGRGGRGGGGGGRGGGRGGRGGGRGGRGGRGGERGDRGGASNYQQEDDGGLEAMLNVSILPAEPMPERPEVTGDVCERAQVAREVVAEMLEQMGLNLTARLVEDGEEIQFDINGDDAARIIGKKGEALLALQFLTNRIVTRRVEGDQHVVLDAAGYRRRRRDALVDLATKLTARAKEERKVVRLSPMSAHDRRVFHVTLAEIDGVSTRSEGSGLFRPLLIIPEEDED